MQKSIMFLLVVGLLAGGGSLIWLWQQADAESETIARSPVQRCMNLSGALEAPVEGLWGYTIREEDLTRIKDHGFDTVRIPIRWRLSDEQGAVSVPPDQLARVDEVVAQALAADLKVIINAHHYNELSDDPDAHEPRLEGLWHLLSQHFKEAPGALMFELINEPHSEMTYARTDALNRRLLSIVRRTNPDRWVIYGTAHWGALEGMLKSDPAYDPKAIIGFHYYEPFEFTHQGAFFVDPPPPVGRHWGSRADRARIRKDFEAAARFRDRAGMPLLVGEFGVYEEVPLNLRADWTGFVRMQAEAAGFGWCHWGFATTFKSYDLNGESWINPILSALLPSPEPLP